MITIDRNAELKLFEFARGIKSDGVPFLGVHFRLSSLKLSFGGIVRFQQLLINEFYSIFGIFDCCCFALESLDVVFVFHVEKCALFRSFIHVILRVIDSNKYGVSKNFLDKSYVIYDLRKQVSEFFKLCVSFVRDNEKKLSSPEWFVTHCIKNLESMICKCMDDNIVVYDPVWVCGSNKKNVLLFDCLRPNYELFMGKFFGLHKETWKSLLRGMFGLHMLKVVYQNYENSCIRAVSFQFPVELVLSEDFKLFDVNVRTVAKTSMIMFEFDISELSEGFESFVNAVCFVRSKGYRVCISGSVVLIDNPKFLSAMTFDMIKMDFHECSLNDFEFSDFICKQISSNRVILAGCDNETIFKFGKERGIKLFQGEYFSESRVVNI